MEAIKALLVNNLNKVINCYCEDCVGRSAIAVAPKLFKYQETPLKDPLSCMCYSCMKDFKWKKYPVKRRAPKGLVAKATKSCGHYIVETKSIEFFKLSERKSANVNITMMKFRDMQYGALMETNKLRKVTDVEMQLFRGRFTYFKLLDDGTWTHETFFNPERIYSDYILLPFQMSENSYLYNGISVTFVLSSDIPESVDELYRLGILYNVLYHDEEYLGYYCSESKPGEYFIHKLDSCLYTEGPADIIRNFRDVPREDILDEIEYHSYDQDEVLRVLDSYCYECSKYKASCLGHSDGNLSI